MKNIEARSRVLGEEKISRLLWRFSLPAVVGLLINALYNVADSIFVGHAVGPIGLTAVTIAFPVMIVMMGIGMLVGSGGAALLSLRLGEGEFREAERIVGNALTLLLLGAGLSTLSGLLYLDPLLLLLGATPDVLPYARDFTQIIFAGSLALYLGMGLNNLIRAAGHPRTAMGTMLIGAVINLLLNPLFIFGLGLGIRGSALATVLAQAVAAVWVLLFFFRADNRLRLRWRNLVLEAKLVREICSIGLSAFLLQIGTSVIVFIYNYQLFRLGGEVAVAAIGIINRVIMLLLMPLIGISQGMQPIIGYNYGAGSLARVRAVLRQGLLSASGICLAVFVVTELWAAQMVSCFTDDPELLAMGTQGMRLSFCMLPILAVPVIGSQYFQAAGRAGQAVFLTLFRQILLVLPLLFLLPLWLGINGVWLVGPVTDVGAALITGALLWREYRRLNRGGPASGDELGK